jgi:uncharacterized protein
MTTTVNLNALALSYGEAKSLRVPVPLGAPKLGGEVYAPKPDAVEARLDVSRTSSGHALRLRFELRVEGPCMRCLEPAGLEIEIDAREVDQPASGDEELRSPYVNEGELDIGLWARDAVALALPAQMLCRPDCAGLCPVCGVTLNDADAELHRHDEGGDPRWAKLRELQ